MEKRYTQETGRPLCEGDDNTCKNLSGYKETRDGKRRYHRFCDRHRRLGHTPKSFLNPRSKRFLPLDKCKLCNEQATQRHRVVKEKGYTKKNVIQVCRPCHDKIHKYLELASVA